MTEALERDTSWAALHDFAGGVIAEHVRRTVPPTEAVLDVGAGWGKYALLLPEYKMHAVEVFAPYVEQHSLRALYKMVFIEDIREFVKRGLRYGAAIFGDSLEHLPAADAIRVVEELERKCGQVIAAVPFEMKQGLVEGNPFERHEQADLNEAVMAERYPCLRLLEQNGHKAVYVSGKVPG